MATLTISLLIESIRDQGLLEGAALRDAQTLAEQSYDPQEIAAELVRRQRLTQYQADELLQGRAEHLVLGSYVLLEPIGEGGMGQVFRARQTVLQRECALKIIRKDRLQSDDAVERFLREARVAARLKHPNIVAIYDAGVVNGVHYLAMELLQGITLAQRVREYGPLPVGQACLYVGQAAAGLQHAYEQGLVHRDIKPQNLFLENSSDQVKILDLGLARVRELPQQEETASGELTKEGAVMGTPDYMAPEQALDTRTADQRADIYSLGCTLYFLLTGRPPFPGGSLTEKLLAHQQKVPLALDQLCTGAPRGLAEVLHEAMAKQPQDRYQTPAEFAAALIPLEYAENILASAPMATPNASPETFRQPPSETAVNRSVDIERRDQPSNKAIWVVVLLLLGVFVLCPVMVIGVGILGVGFLTFAPHGDQPQEVRQVEEVRPVPRAVNDGDAAAVKGEVGAPNPLEELAFGKIKGLAGQMFYLSKDGARILHGSNGKFQVTELDTGRNLFSLPEGLVGLGFATGEPPRVMAFDAERMVHSYHSDTGKELALVPKLQLGNEGGLGNMPANGFPSSRMMPDGKSLLLGQGKLPVLKDLDTGAETSLDINTSDVAVSSKDDFLLTGSQDGKVQLWSLKDSKIVQDFPGAVFGVNAVALSPNGKRVLACSEQSVLVWDRDNPQDRRITIAHEDIVVHAAFAPDSQRILSGDQGGIVRLGNAETGELIRQVKHPGHVTALAFHPDGRRALTAGQDNTIRIWRLPD
jgi:serine/threonine protein kinase